MGRLRLVRIPGSPLTRPDGVQRSKHVGLLQVGERGIGARTGPIRVDSSNSCCSFKPFALQAALGDVLGRLCEVPVDLGVERLGEGRLGHCSVVVIVVK